MVYHNVNEMIIFTDHAKDKLLKELSRLGITESTVAEIVRDPDELFIRFSDK